VEEELFIQAGFSSVAVKWFFFFYRYKPQPEDMILKAFQVLDQESKGFLLTEELTKYMMEEGIPMHCILLLSLKFNFDGII
jgi:Ca2+-binding EF-hand superfamily protein